MIDYANLCEEDVKELDDVDISSALSAAEDAGAEAAEWDRDTNQWGWSVSIHMTFEPNSAEDAKHLLLDSLKAMVTKMEEELS